MRKNILPLIFILAITIVLSLPLLKPGLHTIHDDQQIARLYLFDEAIKSGQFPVRWVDDLGFGFGYPLFNFYPPFVYMLGEIFHIVGFTFIDSIKLVFFSSIIASGLFMYLLAKELWGRWPATISATFYMLVPYRALDIYVRGALAESFAFVWLPAILWSFYKLETTKKRVYIVTSAMFLALLMITHNLIFLPFMLLFPFYLLFLFLKSKDKKRSFILYTSSAILALGTSAFFWLPAIFEKRYTIVDQLLLVNLASYQIHFVYLQQLWNWTWGFGGSSVGLTDGISFKIGKLHLLASFAALILSTFYIIKNKKISLWPILFFILMIIAAFMTTQYSKIAWDNITPLGYLQFPWRFLIFTALFSSLLAGALVYLLRISILKISIGVILILLLVPNLKLYRPQSYRNGLTDQVATSREEIRWNVSKTSYEYLPKGIDLVKDEKGINIPQVDRNNIPKQKVEVIEGNAKFEDIKGSPTEVTFTSRSNEGAQIKANIFNFPGWEVKLNGQKISIDDNNALKLITFEVPAGESKVDIEFKQTGLRLAANLISLFAIFSLITLTVTKWQPKKF
ncbi:MAG: YfhO family protein [Candidatus Curtissbacteria bacterium]|nr:YfhO family protein [Candidatus Curtissbacteria bacterium]